MPSERAATQIRARVGINHVPLSDFLNAFVSAGFYIARLEEPGTDDPRCSWPSSHPELFKPMRPLALG